MYEIFQRGSALFPIIRSFVPYSPTKILLVLIVLMTSEFYFNARGVQEVLIEVTSQAGGIEIIEIHSLP